MRDYFGLTFTSGANVPVSCSITHEAVIVCMSHFTYITTDVTVFITSRAVYVQLIVDFLLAPHTNYPMLLIIMK